MNLYIARHGETEFNKAGRLQGNGKDSPLTPKGIAQAQALGETLKKITKGEPFDAVYSSNLKRASDTTEIAMGSGYKPILDSRLVEIGLGEMEGMYLQEAAETFPEAWGRIADPVNYIPPPGGEALANMIARVDSFLADLAKTKHERVFVLTHGYTLRVFQACAIDKSVKALTQTHKYGNCDIAHYKYENGRMALVEVITPILPI